MNNVVARPESVAGRAEAEVRRWLAEPLAPGLHVVATPIGNLADMTLRGLATLARADVICCEDTRHSRTLLSHFGIARPLVALHEHNEDEASAGIVARISGGAAVALISDAGTPLVSDPGYRLVRAVIASGATVFAIPGPSALLAGLTVSGLPSDTVLFAGFLPAKEVARRDRLAKLLAVPATLVLFEAPGRIAALLGDLSALASDRQVVVARELTKRFEEVRRGNAGDLLSGLQSERTKGEFVVLVEPPAAREVTEAEIRQALRTALATLSLRDAVRAVVEATGAPRTRVYEIGLKLKDGAA